MMSTTTLQIVVAYEGHVSSPEAVATWANNLLGHSVPLKAGYVYLHIADISITSALHGSSLVAVVVFDIAKQEVQ